MGRKKKNVLERVLGRNKNRKDRKVVGFYTDEEKKVRPITKKEALLAGLAGLAGGAGLAYLRAKAKPLQVTEQQPPSTSTQITPPTSKSLSEKLKDTENRVKSLIHVRGFLMDLPDNRYPTNYKAGVTAQETGGMKNWLMTIKNEIYKRGWAGIPYIRMNFTVTRDYPQGNLAYKLPFGTGDVYYKNEAGEYVKWDGKTALPKGTKLYYKTIKKTGEEYELIGEIAEIAHVSNPSSITKLDWAGYVGVNISGNYYDPTTKTTYWLIGGPKGAPTVYPIKADLLPAALKGEELYGKWTSLQKLIQAINTYKGSNTGSFLGDWRYLDTGVGLPKIGLGNTTMLKTIASNEAQNLVLNAHKTAGTLTAMLQGGINPLTGIELGKSQQNTQPSEVNLVLGVGKEVIYQPWWKKWQEGDLNVFLDPNVVNFVNRNAKTQWTIKTKAGQTITIKPQIEPIIENGQVLGLKYKWVDIATGKVYDATSESLSQMTGYTQEELFKKIADLAKPDQTHIDLVKTWTNGTADWTVDPKTGYIGWQFNTPTDYPRSMYGYELPQIFGSDTASNTAKTLGLRGVFSIRFNTDGTVTVSDMYGNKKTITIKEWNEILQYGGKKPPTPPPTPREEAAEKKLLKEEGKPPVPSDKSINIRLKAAEKKVEKMEEREGGGEH